MATTRRCKRRQTSKTDRQGQNDVVPSKPAVKTVRRTRSTRHRQVVVEDSEIVAQWSSVGVSIGVSTDADVAKYLLSLYFARRQETLQDPRCVHCKASLILYCLACRLSSPQVLPITSPQPIQILASKIKTLNPELLSSTQHLRPQASITCPSISETNTIPISVSPTWTQKASITSQSKEEHRMKITHPPDPVNVTNNVTEGVENIVARNSIVDSHYGGGGLFSIDISDVEREGIEDESLPEAELRASSVCGALCPQGSRLQLSSGQMTEVPQGTQESPLCKIESPRGTEWQECPELGTLDPQRIELQGHSAVENLSPQGTESQEHSTPTDPDLYVCPYCSQVLPGYRHKSHISTHPDIVNEKGECCCNMCAKIFPSFTTFYNHIRLCLRDQRCHHCDQVFVSRCQLNKHRKQHEREKARFCEHCQRSLPNMSKKDFDRHVKKHEKTEKGRAAEAALCPECGKVFRKKDDLNTHMTYHNKDSPFPCPLCPKAFKNKACLRQHELFHGDKTQQCEICGAKFYRKAGLKRHMQKHSGKQYGCNECARRFCSSTELQVHIEAVHKGIRHFPCSLCDLKFYKAASLTIHMRTHTGEKPYSCDLCPAKFSVGEALRKHKRRHTGEKPFCCEDCGQTYSCQSSYKMHRKKHHADSLYPCGDCQQVFVVRSSLDFHRKMCHSGKWDMPTKNNQPLNSAVPGYAEHCQLSDNALHVYTENTLPSDSAAHMYAENSFHTTHYSNRL